MKKQGSAVFKKGLLTEISMSTRKYIPLKKEEINFENRKVFLSLDAFIILSKKSCKNFSKTK